MKHGLRFLPTAALLLMVPTWAGAVVDAGCDRPEVAVVFGALGYTGGPNDESGPVLGIEGRFRLAPGWVIGGGVFGGTNVGMLSDDLSLTSLEMNVVRLLPLSRTLCWGVGGGLAAVRGLYENESLFDDTVETEDWVAGAQLGAELDWQPGRFVAGLRASRHFTGDFADLGWSLDHWRVVVRTGVAF